MAFGTNSRTTPVVLNLIIINALVYVAQLVLDRTIGLTDLIALNPFNSPAFRPYQLVTHMFAHSPSTFLHILFNMYALWMFGSILERVWGPKKFLIFYLSCGLAAAVAQMLLSPAPAVGASGAIMGLLAAFAYLFPNVKFYILPFPFPIKAKFMVAIYAAIDLFGGFSGSTDNVAHFAHLGGLVMGFILVMIWGKDNTQTNL
ncbi:rhomboid family intramembrane serine protease [soil metagenome]